MDITRIKELVAELTAEVNGQVAPVTAVGPESTWTRPDGSVATVPPPLPGEGIMSYAMRTSAHTGFPAAAAGSLALMSSSTPFTDWPHIVDYLADPRRYMTVQERQDYDNRVAESNATGGYRGTINPETMTLYDWAFYFQKGLQAKVYDIFDRRPVYRNNFDANGVWIPNGALFVNTSAEFAGVDVSKYPEHGGVLARFA